ncbi:MAG: urea ABC transporter permease subunit UrtB [Thiohalocapsa sp.]|nr:urea ABC transporter permease subunit UrtB [Thiohalocapsa sp.]
MHAVPVLLTVGAPPSAGLLLSALLLATWPALAAAEEGERASAGAAPASYADVSSPAGAVAELAETPSIDGVDAGSADIAAAPADSDRGADGAEALVAETGTADSADAPVEETGASDSANAPVAETGTADGGDAPVAEASAGDSAAALATEVAAADSADALGTQNSETDNAAALAEVAAETDADAGLNPPGAEDAPEQPASLETAIAGLAERSFKVKQQAADDIAASGDERAADLLKALLNGDLYYRKDDKRIVFAEKSAAGLALTDALTGESLGEVGSRDAAKITVNNLMRNSLRTDIATLTLASPDPNVRLSAALEMVGTDDADTLAALRAQRSEESDGRVADAIDLAVAIAELKSEDAAVRLAAVESLRGSLYPAARNALGGLLASETDAGVLAAAEGVLADIESRVQTYKIAETVFFGLSLGSVLVLAAIGLAITFGVMGVINMAHGELIMIGAYTTYLVQLAMPNWIDYSLLVAIPAAFIVSGLFGIAIERTVIRFLYGRPLETLLATFGISLILQQLVRTTISAQNVIVENPSWMSGSLQINPALSLTYNRLYIVVFALMVFVALLLILKRTALGLQVRAVSQNRAMAQAMGVRSARVDALTFGLGAGIAGVAGVALSQLTNVGPNMGQAYIIDSFMVVVFGGVGNLWGTLVGGLTLGIANKFMEPWTGAVLAKILVLVFIILFIQKRPRGLFPQRGRAAEG